MNAIGLTIYKQQPTKIFKNPFYYGLVSHGLLECQVVEGTYEKLICHEVFLKVNAINQVGSGYGVPHKKELDEVLFKTLSFAVACAMRLSPAM